LQKNRGCREKVPLSRGRNLRYREDILYSDSRFFLMEKKITIPTPEQIEFSYELAGPGSRFLAFLLDSLIKTGAVFIIWVLLWRIGFHIDASVKNLQGSLLTTSLSLSTFVLGGLAGFIMIGYYVFFETLWNGQTPGKKVAGLRVIKENGRSINVFDAAARNFLRPVDFLPSLYLLGGLMVQFHPLRKRLGDMVAGTVVVKLVRDARPPDFPGLEVEVPAVQFPLDTLTDEEHELARAFIVRRNELSSTTRRELAGLITGVMMKKLSIAENPFTGEEDLLEWITLEAGKSRRGGAAPPLRDSHTSAVNEGS